MVDYFFPYSSVGLSQETISRYCPFNSEWRKAFFLILLRRDPPAPPHHLVTFWHETIQSYNFSTEKGLYITVVSSYIHHMQGWKFRIANPEQKKLLLLCNVVVMRFFKVVCTVYIFFICWKNLLFARFIGLMWSRFLKWSLITFSWSTVWRKEKKHTPN